MKEKEYLDPGAQLNAAIEILETFTQKNASEPVPHSFHQPNYSENSFKKILKLSRCLFSEKAWTRHSQEKVSEEDRVRQALDEVQRFHQLVDEKLASRALKAIEEYNGIFEHKNKTNWRKKLLKFLINKNDLSLKLSHAVSINPKSINPLPNDVWSCLSTVEPIFKREEDAFKMKAISLIQNHGDSFSTVAEAFHAVRNTPIHSQLSASVITLEQKFSPFPGETLILKGAFQRDPGMPIPESFKLFSESVQTGFPYPIQHTGWALSDSLIPRSPLRPDQLKLLMPLLFEKEKMAEELMRKGVIQTRAREVLAKKEKVSPEKHRELFLAIIESAGFPFSETLLSDCEFFIDKPFNALQNAWVNRSNKELLSLDPAIRLQSAIAILKSVQSENPFENILLQYFSEVIGFPPPKLTLFEKKLQACAFKQLRDFLEELRSGIPNDPLKQIDDEIALFQSESIHEPIVQELEQYFDGCIRT